MKFKIPDGVNILQYGTPAKSTFFRNEMRVPKIILIPRQDFVGLLGHPMFAPDDPTKPLMFEGMKVLPDDSLTKEIEIY